MNGLTDGLTPDELNAICAIPEAIWEEITAEIFADPTVQPRSLVEHDREVLKRWYARGGDQKNDDNA